MYSDLIILNENVTKVTFTEYIRYQFSVNDNKRFCVNANL